MSNGITIVIILVILTAIPFVTKRMSANRNQAKRDRLKTIYKGAADGIVLAVEDKGLEFPWVIHVGYTVDGTVYQIKEFAQLKNSVVKAGKVPIGQRTTFVMGKLEVGDHVQVKYDEADPSKAFIVGNEGGDMI